MKSVVPLRPRSHLQICRSGFSLVEIVLCLGIVAFAFVGIVGLVPVGMSNFRGAIDTSTSAQIFQRVMNDAKQTDFDQLIQPGATEFYMLSPRFFDDQGIEKTSAAGAIYHVRIRGSRPGAAFTSLPGVLARFNLANSTFLTIQVAANPGNRSIAVNPNELWKSEDTSGKPIAVSTFSGVVTRH